MASLGIQTLALIHSSPVRALTFELRTGAPNQTVKLAADFLRWGNEITSTQLIEGPSGMYSLTLPTPELPRVEYQFVVDGTWKLDPTNPDRVPNGMGGYNSLWANPTFSSDPEQLPCPPHLPCVDLIQINIPGLENAFQSIHISFPKKVSRPVHLYLIYFQDGDDFLNKTGVKNILARWSEQTLSDSIYLGVYVTPKNRMRQYHPWTQEGREFIRQFNETLIPAVERWARNWIKERTPMDFALPSPTLQHTLVGASMGGLFSAVNVLENPTLFRGAVSLSGSFWIEPDQFEQLLIEANERYGNRGPQLVFHFGTYETASLQKAHHQIRSLGEKLHLPMNVSDSPSIHSWISWKEEINSALRALIIK